MSMFYLGAMEFDWKICKFSDLIRQNPKSMASRTFTVNIDGNSTVSFVMELDPFNSRSGEKWIGIACTVHSSEEFPQTKMVFHVELSVMNTWSDQFCSLKFHQKIKYQIVGYAIRLLMQKQLSPSPTKIYWIYSTVSYFDRWLGLVKDWRNETLVTFIFV